VRRLHASARRSNAQPVDDAEAPFDLASVERVEDEADVLIVGGGPAGLSAAIKIKQLAEAKGEEIRVVLLEKGAEVGEWQLSGRRAGRRGACGDCETASALRRRRSVARALRLGLRRR
jgi:2-polyprenyl-6-methoxyphenol hydroxylase-like FAD-dependent oxidoreductase